MNNFNSDELLNKIEIVENKNSCQIKKTLLEKFEILIKDLEKTEEETIKNMKKTIKEIDGLLNFQYSEIEKIIEKSNIKTLMPQHYAKIKTFQKLIDKCRVKDKDNLNILKEHLNSKINNLNLLENKLKTTSIKFIIFEIKKLQQNIKIKTENLNNFKKSAKTLIENLAETFKYVKYGKNYPIPYAYFPEIKEINVEYYEKQFNCLTDLWNELIELINADYYSEEKLNFKIMELCLEKYDEIHSHLIDQQKK